MNIPSTTLFAGMRDRRGIVALAIGCLLLFALVGVYGYAFHLVSAKAQHTADLSAQYNAIAGKDTRQTSLRIALHDTEVQAAKMDTLFLHGDPLSQSQFASSLESLGAQVGTNLTINNMSEKDAATLTVDLEATGPFRNVMQLVNLIELLPYKIAVTKVYLSAEGISLSAGDTATSKKTPGPSVWKAAISFDVQSYLKQS